MNTYSFADIEKYLQGKLSPAEMHELEKAAVQDPFLADAIEGYQSTDIKDIEHDLAYINNQLLSEPTKIIPAIVKRNISWQVAAASIVLVGAGIFGWKIFTGKNNTQDLAKQESIVAKDTVRSLAETYSKKEALTEQKTTLLANNNSKPVPNYKNNSDDKNIASRGMVKEQAIAAISPNTLALREHAYEKDTILLDKKQSKDLAVSGNLNAGILNEVSIQANGNNISRYMNKQTELARAKPNTVSANANLISVGAGNIPLTAQVNKVKVKVDTIRFEKEDLPNFATNGYSSSNNLSITTVGSLTSLTVAGNIAAGSNNTSKRARISIDTPVILSEQKMNITFYETPLAASSTVSAAIISGTNSKAGAQVNNVFNMHKDSITFLDKNFSASAKNSMPRSVAPANASKESGSYIRRAVSVNPEGGWYNFTKYLINKIAADESIKKKIGQHGSVEIKMNISEKGKVSKVRILTSFNAQLDPIIIKAVRWGPRWLSSDFLEKKDFIFKVNL